MMRSTSSASLRSREHRSSNTTFRSRQGRVSASQFDLWDTSNCLDIREEEVSIMLRANGLLALGSAQIYFSVSKAMILDSPGEHAQPFGNRSVVFFL